ncbi:rho GTPase-activating protein 35-like isoform X3 [Lytechinus variegatus]|uniref:rho GTPase-activating protein 35-like isoform X3 n=1 Tax=Lytechinus variegatus TaxID=7654 RepID=UPI001BB1A729|nr:rho GTPase-activating protein 35-like isoform X3 [Lytechinus variegatus]
MARQKPEKIYHIAVVGMSGTETERGATGVGKSCLCNRFMNPHQDKYYTDHISVISSSDFSGRIVNNDHFLYWGECTKKYDGDTMTFRVVEQTEFIDDSSFSPLRGSNTHPYYKRAAVTKLQSAEKVMYICKDQVGDETNFPQKILPDGKFPVDGYLIIYDVSRSPGHEKQIEWLTKLQSQLHKAKRPVVVVAAKFDEAWDQYVRDAKAFAMKIKAPLIETSSQEGVNVDLAFATIASKIDKRGGPKELPFTAGNEQRQKVITRAVDEYESMLKLEVTNYHDLWTSRKKQYQNRDVFRKVVELIGTKNAKNYFTRHTQRLRQNHQQNKMKLYLGRLPDALETIFPDLNSISGRDWTECRMLLPQMAHFDEWFIILPQDQTWRESEYIDTDELRIPYDLLEGYEVECENCFQDHVNRLNAAKRKERMKAEFKKLLESLPNIVLPFRSMDEDVVMEAISNHESYKELDESTKIAIYNVHQEDIQARAQSDFIELLMEKYALLAGVDITQKPSREVEKLVKQLEHEPRWQKLSEMSLERYIMLIKQLAFVHNPTTDSCYYGEKCMEKLTQSCIERTVQKSPIKELGTWDDSSNRLNIVVIGEDGLADELDTEIKNSQAKQGSGRNLSQSQSYDGDYTLDKVLYSLDLKTIEGDITHPGNQLQTESFTPQGCICVFTSLEGFQYVRDCLERTILSDREEYNSSTLRDLAVVLMFGRSTSPEADTAQVREQADRLSNRLNNCQIVNVPPDNTTLWQGKKFSESQIQEALRSVVAGQKYRSGTPNQAESDRGENGDNAFRIGLCMTCGDPFQPDLVLSPITSHNFMATPNEKNCITCDLFLIDTKCRVDFEISSYHLSESLRDQRVHHGYILVYAAQRKASLEMLRWFMKLVEPIPTLVVAVCEDINSAADGIAEGQRLVDGTATAKLVPANCSSFREQTVIYNSFLKEAHRKRKETEKLYKADEIAKRPPMELPSPSRDASVDDAQTPTSGFTPEFVPRQRSVSSEAVVHDPLVKPSEIRNRMRLQQQSHFSFRGVEDQVYDEIGHQQSRWAPKPSNEARMYHTANYESRQRRWGSEVRRKPNLPLPSTPQSTGTEDSFHPPSPTKPKVKPKPPVRSSSRKQEYSPGDNESAFPSSQEQEEIKAYGEFRPRTTRVEPEEIAAYGEYRQQTPKQTEENPVYGVVDRSAKKTATKPAQSDEIPEYGVIDRSRKKPAAEPAPSDDQPLYGVVDRATKKPSVPAPVEEGLYGVVNKPAKSPKPKVLPKPDAVYGVVNKPKKSPKPLLSTTGSELEGITGTAGMWTKADENPGNDIYAVVDKSRKTEEEEKITEDTPEPEDVYATVDKQRKPTEQNPSPDDPPSDGGDPIYGVVDRKRDRKPSNRDLGGRIVGRPTEVGDDSVFGALYSEVNKGFKTSTPDTNRSLDGSAVFGPEEKWKLPGLASDGIDENNISIPEEEAETEGMVENVLYEPYTSQKSPAPSGMVDNVLYAPYSSQMSPASQTGDSMTYASVQDHRPSEDPNDGMMDNILYAPYTPPAESRPRQPPPPTAPKPGKLDLSKFPVRMEGLIRPMGSVNRPNDLPVWHHRRTPAQNNHPPPFASPESDEGAGYASPADALPYDQVRKVIGSSFRTGSSGGGGPQSGIYSQPHDHLPRGTVQKISYGKPMVALPPRPSGLPVANDSTPEALSADVSRSRETPRQTPVKRPLGTVDARNKKREDFLKGLNKLIEDSMDSSFQDEPNTPRDKPKPKKQKGKGKKKGQPLVPKKPVKPALETLMVTENGVPSFIEQCVQKIEEEGITQEGIYRVSGKAADIETIIKMFDEDQNADLCSLENLSSNTVASALKQFFKNLPEPIIPYSTQDRMIADYKEVNNEDLFVERLPEYLVGLSQVKKTVLTYMMKHMKRITQCSEENLMTAENLSICWWPSMLHPQSKSFDDLANEALLAAVFKLIVEHSETLFDFFT